MKFQRTLGRIGVSRILLILGCLIAATLLPPALAVAEPAASEEYDLAPLPEGTGEDGGASAGDNTVGSAGSDGGGGPNSLLIALAATAALCTGFAIWRLRKHSHHHT